MIIDHALVNRLCGVAPLFMIEPGLIPLHLLLDPPFRKCRRSMQRLSRLTVAGSILPRPHLHIIPCVLRTSDAKEVIFPIYQWLAESCYRRAVFV